MTIRGRRVHSSSRPALRLPGVLCLALAALTIASLASASFAFAAASPVVSQVRANSGPVAGGTTVTITGKNFKAAGKSVVKKVLFGTKAATKLHVKSATKLTVVAPHHAAGTVDVYVVGMSGSKSAKVAADRYAFMAPLPTITLLNPVTGPAAGGTAVTITGANFKGATAVSFGVLPATAFSVVSGSTITATSPVSVAGQVEVSVTTAAGTSEPTSADWFTFSAPPAPSSAPTVTAVSPASGAAASTVTITGTKFTGTTSVIFGAAAAPAFTVVSDTSITATVPDGVGIVDVQVVNAAGESGQAAADWFTYTTP